MPKFKDPIFNFILGLFFLGVSAYYFMDVFRDVARWATQ